MLSSQVEAKKLVQVEPEMFFNPDAQTSTGFTAIMLAAQAGMRERDREREGEGEGEGEREVYD